MQDFSLLLVIFVKKKKKKHFSCLMLTKTDFVISCDGKSECKVE